MGKRLTPKQLDRQQSEAAALRRMFDGGRSRILLRLLAAEIADRAAGLKPLAASEPDAIDAGEAAAKMLAALDALADAEQLLTRGAESKGT